MEYVLLRITLTDRTILISNPVRNFHPHFTFEELRNISRNSQNLTITTCQIWTNCLWKTVPNKRTFTAKSRKITKIYILWNGNTKTSFNKIFISKNLSIKFRSKKIFRLISKATSNLKIQNNRIRHTIYATELYIS